MFRVDFSRGLKEYGHTVKKGIRRFRISGRGYKDFGFLNQWYKPQGKP